MAEEHIRFKEVYAKQFDDVPSELLEQSTLPIESWLRQGGLIVEFVLNAGRERTTAPQEMQAERFKRALREWSELTGAYEVIGLPPQSTDGARLAGMNEGHLLMMGSVGIAFTDTSATSEFGRRQVLGDIAQTPGLSMDPFLEDIAEKLA